MYLSPSLRCLEAGKCISSSLPELPVILYRMVRVSGAQFVRNMLACYDITECSTCRKLLYEIYDQLINLMCKFSWLARLGVTNSIVRCSVYNIVRLWLKYNLAN